MESFKLANDRLEQVHSACEMQIIVSGVGDLKKSFQMLKQSVLDNCSENILEQLLTSDQILKCRY